MASLRCLGAGGEAEALDGRLQDFFAFGGDGAVFGDEFGRHLGIGVDGFFRAVTLKLDFASAQHAGADAGGAFNFHVARQFLVLRRWDFDVDIYAVEQRPGNFLRRSAGFGLASSDIRVWCLRKIRKGTDSWQRQA
jgi:hypothetical protein